MYALKYCKYYIASSLAYLKIYDKEQQRKFILLKSISWLILLSFRNKRYKLQIKNIIEPYQTNINTRKRMKYWCLAFRHMSKDYMNFNLFVRNKLLQWLRQSLYNRLISWNHWNLKIYIYVYTIRLFCQYFTLFTIKECKKSEKK